MPTYTDPGPIESDAEILREDVDNSQAYVVFPHDALRTYGVKGRVPVTVRFDDRVDYRGSLVT
ncbi:MAG: DUF1905 domain-containing protein [Actinomycetota bacterium]|nr:DUF1905 domain-containing protein [Actinomycetota bacterium]